MDRYLGGFYKFNVTIKKIKNGVRKTFRRFWISFGILLFIIRSHSPLCSLFLHSNLLETNFKIVRNEFIEPTFRQSGVQML